MSPHHDLRSFASVTGFDSLSDLGYDRASASYARAKLVLMLGGAVFALLTTLLVGFAEIACQA